MKRQKLVIFGTFLRENGANRGLKKYILPQVEPLSTIPCMTLPSKTHPGTVRGTTKMSTTKQTNQAH